jgi:hypothetical protein
MSATLSVENRTLDVMSRRDFTAPFLAALAFQYGYSGLSQPRLSQAFSGMKPLGNESATQLWSLVQDIDDFCQSVRPIPVSLKNPLVIKPLLDDYRAKKKAQEETFVTYTWSLRMDAYSYFKTLQNGVPVRTVSLHEAAAFESLEIANEAAKRLKVLKIDSRPDSFTNARRKQAEIISSTEQFSQLGYNNECRSQNSEANLRK